MGFIRAQAALHCWTEVVFPEWARYCASILEPIFREGGWAWYLCWHAGGPDAPQDLVRQTRRDVHTILWSLSPGGGITAPLWYVAMAFLRAARACHDGLTEVARMWHGYNAALARGDEIGWADSPLTITRVFPLRDVPDAEATF